MFSRFTINNRVVVYSFQIGGLAPQTWHLAERTGKDTASKQDILDGMRSKIYPKKTEK